MAVAYSASRGSSASDVAPDSATTRWKSTYRCVTRRSTATSGASAGLGSASQGPLVGRSREAKWSRSHGRLSRPRRTLRQPRPPAEPRPSGTQVPGCSASSACLVPFPAKWADAIDSPTGAQPAVHRRRGHRAQGSRGELPGERVCRLANATDASRRPPTAFPTARPLRCPPTTLARARRPHRESLRRNGRFWPGRLRGAPAARAMSSSGDGTRR